MIRAGTHAVRLLAGRPAAGRIAGLEDHLRTHGPPAYGGDLITAVERAGLTGRGGAGFPTARKLRSVAGGRRRPVIVVNAAESEPASAKDRFLLTVAPHLVLDGALAAAQAVDARDVIIAVHPANRMPALPALLDWALGQRRTSHRWAPPGITARVCEVPARYIAGEETALVHWINDGRPVPTGDPPRPYQRGVDGRPTLVSNAETYAHIALISRHGPDWFRSAGTPDAPGTALFTISGAVARPGVVEAPLGTPAGELLRSADGPSEPVQALLTGGYGGAWLAAERLGTPATAGDFAVVGATLGPGILIALPQRACGLAETSRVLTWLAGHTAGQCGPCVFGLPAIAGDLAAIVAGQAEGTVHDRLHRRLDVISGRGACRHPDGAVRLARSALRVFEPHLDAHGRGRVCPATTRGYLPIPRGERP